MRNYLFAGAAAAALMVPASAYAQQITTEISGQVVDAGGLPVSGATVTITDTRTGSDRTITTDGTGRFQASNLTSGGPYTATATAPGFQGQTVENLQTTVQGATTLSFELAAASGTEGGEDIIVVGSSQANVGNLALGPGQSFGAEVLETLPTITRDVRDFIRIDPRVSLDRSNEVDRISCLGGNDRANTFTVDGIVQADVFGLNGTPFASRNSLPLPFDVIRETSVEFAPFDVEYGAFTGCAINVITKSGENKFHGSGFFTFTSNDFTGSSIDGEDATPSPFERKRWGATLGGPIIPDRLFFFGGYEETDLGNSQDEGPTGAGYINEVDGVSVAQFNEFSQILSDTYGIDTGGLATTLPESSRRFFGRVDWYINDQHRLEATYQKLEEINTEPDDFSSSNVTGFNTFEEEGTNSNYYSVRLYSNWTDKLSTEFRASRSEVTDIQGPVGGGEAQSDNPIPRIIVGTTNNGVNGTLQAGPGFSRTSNELVNEVNQYKFLARYNAGNHTIKFGAELNELFVYNLFGQNTTGTLTFNSLADLREGLLSGGTNTFPSATQVVAGQAAGAYGNFSRDGDINSAAIEFNRTIFTVYGQDEWQATDRLKLLGGVRVDWFDGDRPQVNDTFLARYGFSNSVPFSKFDPILLPRLGFTYELENEGFFRRTQVKGGVGLFSGGDPTVYFSNAYTNFGFGTGFGATGVAGCGPTGTRLDVVTGGTFTGLPECIVTNGSAQANRGLADTQSIDPSFDQPTVLRANLGVSTRFGTDNGFFSNWRLNLDYIYSRFRNPIDFVDLAQAVDTRLGLNGFTVDGRPIYRAVDTTAAGCDATLIGTGGTPPQYANLTPACFATGRDDEIQLTNGQDYDSHVASVVLNKQFDRGLLTEGGGVYLNLGYAFTDANNNRYNNSSTATSSYDITAAFDRQNPAIATSEYETRHNITFSMNFREQFFDGYDTQFGFVFVARSGRPYSVVFDDFFFNDSASGSDNGLAYIPTGPNDPNVVYAPTTGAGGVVLQTAAQAQEAYEGFISSRDCVAEYRGQTIPRNSCKNDWFYDLDLRFSQELPGPARIFGVEDRIQVFADFDNFLNLLDDKWNVFRRRGYTVPVVNSSVNAAGQYVISDFRLDEFNNVQTSSSLWRIQVGVNYKF